MKISNLPEHRTKRHYQDVITEKVCSIEKHPWVLSVFQMGSVGCPGISDIDLIVVTEDGGFNGSQCNVKTPDDDYYFLHDALWIRKRDLDNLTNIFCTTKIMTPTINDNFYTIEQFALTDEQKLIYLIEICFNKLLQISRASRRTIDARGLLTRASSIIHSVDLAIELGISNIRQAEIFSKEILQIRQEWMASKGMLEIDFIKLYSSYSAVLVNLLDSCLSQKSYLFTAKQSSSILHLFRSRNIMIGSKVDFDEFNAQITIPPSLIAYFSGYDNQENTHLGKAQQSRKKALTSHLIYLKNNNLMYSLRSSPAVNFETVSRYKEIAKNLVKKYYPLRKN